ncbi:hypothetical protein CPAR01_00183, partial [Colletotrichum paranaense]
TDTIKQDISTLQNAGSPDEELNPEDPIVINLANMAPRNPDLRKMVQQVAHREVKDRYIQRMIDKVLDEVPEDSEFRERVGQQGDSAINDVQSPDSSIPLSDTGANSDAGSLASRLTWINGPYNPNHSWFPAKNTRTTDSGNTLKVGELEESYSQLLPPPAKQEAPLTDSGYASRINVENLPRMELTGADTSGNERDDSNARTAYSGDSTVAIDQAQQYIFELSNTIHSNLGGNVDADNWRLLSERVLGLIKDFAIKIGLESSAQVNRDIMHFIHKRSRDIATRLDSMILSVDASAEDADEIVEARRDHMLLSDKMALWISKATGTETSVNDDELFVGVTDVEATIDAPALFEYNKTVTESDSFKWLIESLRRELTLKRDFDESEGCNRREMIRRKVIESLPTGKISKNRPPTTHSVTFRVPGWALFRSSEEYTYGREWSVPNAVVVTHCSGDAQASMIVDYMEQTWPSTWLTIFNLLRTVSRSSDGIVYADILHDQTQISVSSEHGILTMSLDGPAHTIAECGEQLAWLRASWGNPPPQHGMSNTVQRIPFIMKMATLHGRLWFDIGVQNPIPDEFALLEQSRWTDLLGNDEVVVVPGYPILRRPNSFNGIEVSPRYLIESLGPVSRYSFTAGLVLDGLQRRLLLMKHVQNVYLWHETQSAERPFCHCSTPGNQDKGTCSGRTIDLEEILRGRHIIGQCQGLCLDEDDSVPTLGKESSSIGNDSPYHSVSSSSVMGAYGAESPKSTASSEKVTVENGDMNNVSSFSWDDDAISWALCQNPNGNRANSSEELEPLADDDPIRAVVETVVFRLVAGFRYVAGGEVPSCGNGQDHGTVSSSSTSGIAASSRPAGKGRKRKQVQDDNSDSEEDATHSRPSKRSRKTQQHIKLLACPFGKMSPSKYSACSRFQLKRIRDVKQHLKRKHTPDDYCNRCLSIFDDEESLTQHVSQPDGFGCQLAPEGRTLDGITHRQSRDLSRKVNAELSEEQQWFAVWDTVFPRKPRPDSAYLDSAFATQVCLFREHCARHAEPLLAQNLRAAGLLDERRVAADQERLLRRVISESLDSICDTFSTNTSSDSGIGRSRNSTRNETPTASLVDSGIGIGSQFQTRTDSFAIASNPQQNIRLGPTDVPPDLQTLESEGVAMLGLQAFTGLHQSGSLVQSSTAEFSMDHDLPSVEHRLDELGMFDLNLSADLPPLELSSWTFPQTELIPHEEGAENAV